MPFIDDVIDGEGIYDPSHYAMRNSYPARSMAGFGAVTVAGSDAPVDDRSPRPFVNMAVAVTRQGEDGNVLNAGETLDIHEAIAAYTVQGASHLNHEDRTGSIEPGKNADLAVLDRNIVELYEAGEGLQIGNTRVDLTLFAGELIYRRD
jgi:predicted amidohydrolase YtcJ